MKTSAEKSSSTTSTTARQTSSQPFFARAGEGSFFAPATTVVPAVQMKMTVNKPGDKFEQEADKMADKVMRMPAPASPIKEEKLQRQPADKLQKKDDEKIQKAPAATEKFQRKAGDSAPAVGANVQSAIQNQTAGGQPLSADVRSYMEPRFGADFSNVRIHNDPEAAGLSNQLSARAFTYQNHVFFSRDQYQPGTSEGKQLLAHELTHTIQQGHSIQRSPQVSTTTTPPPIQRLGLDDALNKFAEWANLIPGFRMLTIIIGFNPINMSPTDRSAANILRALIELVPIGVLVSQALDNYGVFNKAGAWVEQQIAILGSIGSEISAALRAFMRSLSWTDIFDLGGVWDRAKSIFTGPIGRVKSFAEGVFTGLIRLVKEAVLRPLAAMAEGTAGYPLLKAVLGQDPITGDPVPRNADTLIGGFMKLIGQEEIWENLKKGNAVARAWAWFQGALSGLMGFVRAIPGKIVETISSITWQDIITIAGVFVKVGKAFLNIASEFLSWALEQVISLLEILFSVVAPGVMPYIKKAQAAFSTIIKNPIGFVGNLVRAGKLGFQMFAGNILEHLKAALIRWITGPLGDAGVYIPKSFSLMEIIKLVLSVFGLTWQNIRSKLVKIIPEPVLVVLEKTAGVLVTLVTQGPVAAWEQIKAELSELKDQMIAQITQMVTVEVVKAAVMKLVSMINPAGAVIQAIIAIYNTVTFFISKISQIAGVVATFIDSIAAIAAGQVDAAAKKVEQTMANTLPLIIAFLAKLVGLGNVPEKVVGIIKKLRQPIDKGLDKIVAWLGNLLKKIGTAAKSAFNWLFAKKSFTDDEGKAHSIFVDGKAGAATVQIASTPMPAEAYLGLYKRTKGADFVNKNKGKLSILEASISKAKKLTGDIDRLKEKNSADPAIQGLQSQLSAEMVNITKVFSELIGVGGKSKMDPPITVIFNIEKKYQKPAQEREFKRQINMQEVRINNLLIKDWLVNRQVFVTQGRTGDSAKDKARRDFIKAEVDKVYSQTPETIEVKKLKMAGINSPEQIKEQLTILVKGRYKGKAVLHTVDQVAGGSGTEFGDAEGIFGDTNVNSSIGSQWTAADRIGKLEKAVSEISPDVYPKEKMKVHFDSRKA